MSTILIVGIIIITGFIFGEIVSKMKLPRITGYIIAGIILNPEVTPFMPKTIMQHTDFVTNMSLSFITFCIGGTLAYSTLKRLGKGIIAITILEAEVTFAVVTIGLALILPFIVKTPGASFLAVFLPASLIIGALASPTDPTGTLAVVHEYDAKGDVTSTILSASAFDDALGLINFSLAFVLAQVLILHQKFSVYSSFVEPLIIVVGALGLGTIFGIIFNMVTKLISKETEGVLIVVILGLLAICFGIAHLLGLDELLSTMTVGIIVTNFNIQRDKIFKILERYTEELVFVLFFTLSGMFLDFGVLATAFIIVLLYTILRTVGKFAGTALGAAVAKSSPLIKKYTAFGLIPSGGIIIGLALTLKQTPAYDQMADIIIGVIIGATVIHEFIGPILVKFALKRSNEIV